MVRIGIRRKIPLCFACLLACYWDPNSKQASKQSITGSSSESLSEPLIPTPFEPADGDFAEGGHRKRALILYYPVRGLSEYRT